VSEAPPSGLSIVLPVHNEAAVVEGALTRMLTALAELNLDFEVVVVENGSRDATLEIVRRLAAADRRIHLETLATADYGQALQHGIQTASCDKVVIFNVDYWSAEFVQTALAGLDRTDMVIGSKVMGKDRRPVLRRIITRGFNLFLRAAFDFGGTDTHGMKAFRRPAFSHLAADCVSKGGTFDTELVLRAERAGLTIVETAVDTMEIRPPSYASILARAPDVIRNLAVMRRALRSVPRKRKLRT
jgi:glycosyltransferase involved in cell wall biosynthesis